MDSTRKFQKPSDAELRKKLTPEQYRVTQHEATEAPFKNEYNDNHAAGIYVDVVSGEPLFSSLDKFDAHCGWPSFSKPLDEKGVTRKVDYKLGVPRTEVRECSAASAMVAKCDRRRRTRIWAMSSMTGPVRQDSGIA